MENNVKLYKTLKTGQTIFLKIIIRNNRNILLQIQLLIFIKNIVDIAINI